MREPTRLVTIPTFEPSVRRGHERLHNAQRAERIDLELTPHVVKIHGTELVHAENTGHMKEPVEGRFALRQGVREAFHRLVLRHVDPRFHADATSREIFAVT